MKLYPHDAFARLFFVLRKYRDRLAEYAAELDEPERELTREMIALEKQLAVVDAELAKLPENQEKVLRLRYLDGLEWEKVTRRMRYSSRQCRRMFYKTQEQCEVLK